MIALIYANDYERVLALKNAARRVLNVAQGGDGAVETISALNALEQVVLNVEADDALLVATSRGLRRPRSVVEGPA